MTTKQYLVQIEEECYDVSAEVKKHYEISHEHAKKGDIWGPLYNQLAKCGTMCSFLKSRIQNNEKGLVFKSNS